jgi:FAD/FMN-containing dehydrogenase
MMASLALASNSLISALAASGAEVLTDDASLNLYAHDIYERGADLAAVVRPADKDQLSAAVAAATGAGHALVARGGGMSYTGGFTQRAAGAVLIDTARMNRIIAVNAEDMTVIVEAGCTWAKLYETLKPLRLRTPFWGTLSGLKATVGGGMSQNCLFWGSARHGSGAQSCLALEVVLADGTLLKSGTGFARPYGPDLMGLFLADTGAFGIKAEITLRLVREAAAHAYASFTFDTHGDALGALAEIERAGVATEIFGFDPNLNAIRMKRDSLAADAKALVGMMKAQGSVLKALKEGAKVALAGRDFLKEASYSLHILTEARQQAAADADIAEARAIARTHRGTETENTIPKIIRANPFGPLNSMLGPEGERWAPVHGIVPHSKAVACYEAILALFAERKAEMDSQGLHTGTLITALGGQGTLIEPCLYWPDASNPLIDATVEAAHLAKLPRLAPNAPAQALVAELKSALADLFLAHGAAHFQIGRVYRYRAHLDPAADALLAAVKAQLDPAGRMNPGVLGL